MKAPREASPCRTRRAPRANDAARAMPSSFSCIGRVYTRALRLSSMDQPPPHTLEQIDPTRVLAVVATVAREARPHITVDVALDSSLERELGLDSLARVELVLRLEREFGSSLPEQALASSETPRDLLRFLLAAVGQAPQTAEDR